VVVEEGSITLHAVEYGLCDDSILQGTGDSIGGLRYHQGVVVDDLILTCHDEVEIVIYEVTLEFSDIEGYVILRII